MVFPLLELALALCLSLGWARVPPLGVRVSLSRALAEGVVGTWHVLLTECMSQAIPGAVLALLSDDAETPGPLTWGLCSKPAVQRHTSRGALLVRWTL